MLFFDGINHPDAETVAADGLDGGMLYLGTPTSGKDLTAAQYADYKAHGLFTAVGFEHVVDDWRGGASAGRANGGALLADARAKHVDLNDPFWVAGADQHVAAADLPTVVAYVRAYVATVRAGGWRGPAGGYGFPEVTTALHSAGVVDWYWGAGRRADQPAFINVWQDNNNTIVVGGSTDDEDWVLIPLPTTEDNMDLTQANLDAIALAVAGYTNPKVPGDVDMHQHAADATTAAKGIAALTTQVANLAKAVAALQAGQAVPLAGTYPITGTLNVGTEVVQLAPLIHMESAHIESVEDTIRRLVADGTIQLKGDQ